MKRLFALFLALVLTAPLTGCGYNAMQQQEENVFGAAADLDAALQRRADLIPNLVETVKAAAASERSILTEVVEARAKATSTKLTPEMLTDKAALANLQAAQGELSSALSRLMVVVERYPVIQSNQNFLALQSQLEGTENRIAVARKRYNDAVRAFNFSIRKFPNRFTNSMLLNLERKEFFQADEGAQDAPAVNFGTSQDQ